MLWDSSPEENLSYAYLFALYHLNEDNQKN